MAGETPSDAVPPWVTFILTQVQQQFDGLNRRLDDMVGKEAFRQEQSRVNEKFDTQGREISDLKVALTAEATARVTAERALSTERAEEQKDREREQANRRWLVFGLVASPLAAALVAWVVGGGLGP